MDGKIRSMDDPEEKLDLVNDLDEPIGSIERKSILNILAGNDGFVRGVLIFLINSSGELFITKRSDTKKIAPGGLDCSASGHVKQGYSYEQAAIEELHEELDISIKPPELIYIGSIPPFEGVPYFHKLYLVCCSKTPTINHDDFSSAQWTTPKELNLILKDDASAKDTLLPALKLLNDYSPEINQT